MAAEGFEVAGSRVRREQRTRCCGDHDSYWAVSGVQILNISWNRNFDT